MLSRQIIFVLDYKFLLAVICEENNNFARLLSLTTFDTVGWATGRASGL